MKSKRRSFLKKLGLLTGAFTMPNLINADIEESIRSGKQKYALLSDKEFARKEDFWYQIQQSYSASPTIMNLNNGGVAPSPKVVQEAVELYNKLSNQAPSYYMWRILDQGREPLRQKLADLAGCPAEEIAIDRNSSEALETVIFGLPLSAGDEVVLSYQDYPNMMNAWKQRELRDGIVLKWVDLDVPLEDDEYIVNLYEEKFSSRTRIVHVTHLINWMGQILPARKIANRAHQIGAEVILDAAHSFAHVNYKIPDLGCDYFGSSLHKWLSAPFGSGMLYVKKEKISTLYPLFAAPDPTVGDIRKFEHLGTRSFAIEQAIAQAVNFHQMIGSANKQARLEYLKQYWTQAVKKFDRVHIGTSLKPGYSCALALLQIDGMSPQEVGTQLFQKYKIHTTSIDYRNIQGVRITPNVYTLAADLDKLIDAVHKISSS